MESDLNVGWYAKCHRFAIAKTMRVALRNVFGLSFAECLCFAVRNACGLQYGMRVGCHLRKRGDAYALTRSSNELTKRQTLTKNISKED